MKKNWGDNRMKKLFSEMWGNTVWGAACENSKRLFMYDGSIETVEYFWVNVSCMLDLVTKLQKYTPFAYSWSTSKECKKWNAVCISNQGSDVDWMERYQIVKARVCFQGLLSKILRRLSQFYEIQTGGWPREVLHVAKTKTIRRWELNTSDNLMNLRPEDFLWGDVVITYIRCEQNTIKDRYIYTRGYVQCAQNMM